jgi:uncharacterized membrane protein
MSKKKTSNPKSKTENKRMAKKAIILGAETKRRTPVYIIMGCSVLLVGAAVLVFFGFISPQKNTAEATAAIGQADRVITYPVTMFSDGKARHFEYKTGDISIRYFILKSSDGVIRAAFDACDVCWPANKGYFQAGDTMVCRNCGRRFASVLVNEVKGGCNPAPLNRSVQGDNLVIQIDDLHEGKQYFNFSGKA